MRSAVDLPEPDGPTRTVKPPSGMSRSRSSTACVPSGKTLVTPVEGDAGHLLLPTAARAGDVVAVPERAALGHARAASRSRRGRSRSAWRSRAPTRSCRAATRRSSGARRRRRRRARASASRWSLQVVDALAGPRRIAVDDRAVVEGGAVLGDVDRQRRRSRARSAHEQLVQAVGVDLPAHRGGRRACGGAGASSSGGASRSAAHALRDVVVDAEEVDRRARSLAGRRRARRRAARSGARSARAGPPGSAPRSTGPGTSGSGGRPSAARRRGRRPSRSPGGRARG